MSSCSSTCCALCFSKFNRRRHFHSEGWSDAMLAFFRDKVTCHSSMGSVCVCSACERNVRHCYKKWSDGAAFKFRWLKVEKKCSVPFCESKEIKACKHSFTWEEVCSSVGITTIDPCADTELPLCSKHYQIVYRMKNAREIEDSTCKVCVCTS